MQAMVLVRRLYPRQVLYPKYLQLVQEAEEHAAALHQDSASTCLQYALVT